MEAWLGKTTDSGKASLCANSFFGPGVVALEAGVHSLIVGWERPLHWGVAGAVIAGVVLVLLFRFNRALGVSTGLEDICALWSRRPYFRRPGLVRAGGWRLPFWLGLVLGGFVSSALAGGWAPTWDLGMWDTMVAGSQALKVGWMFVGGLFIGFGTRLAGGCTSGHGIFGVSNLEKASFVTMLCFMASGIATTFALHHFFGGAGS